MGRFRVVYLGAVPVADASPQLDSAGRRKHLSVSPAITLAVQQTAEYRTRDARTTRVDIRDRRLLPIFAFRPIAFNLGIVARVTFHCKKIKLPVK